MKLEEVVTKEDFKEYLSQFPFENEGLSGEDEKKVLNFCKKFGISEAVTRMHRETPKKR